MFVAVFTALSLFSAMMSWLFTVRTGASMWTLQPDASATAWYVVAMNLVYWGSWAPLAPLVLALASRCRIDAMHWRRSIPIHFVAGFACACVHIVVVASGRTVLQRLAGMEVSWIERVWEMFFRTIDWEFTLYGALVALQHAVDYYNELRARDVRAAHLETKLVEAQLQALQRQLHPHFLFNTLHAISSLVQRAPEKAELMIERLSDLLRITLDKVGIQEVTVSEEIDYLKAYLDIEQVHFGDRLTVCYRIEAAALDALVPNLILQPLAENAIRHGLEPRAGRGRLTIEARCVDDRLILRVEDNGRGLRWTSSPRGPSPIRTRRSDPSDATEPPHPPHQPHPPYLPNGVGLSNTRSRLERLYRDEATITLTPNLPSGVVVTLTLPLRRRAATAQLSPRHAALARR